MSDEDSEQSQLAQKQQEEQQLWERSKVAQKELKKILDDMKNERRSN